MPIARQPRLRSGPLFTSAPVSATTNSPNRFDGRPKPELISPACSVAVRRGKTVSPSTAKKGIAALEDWLAEDGVRNIGAVNDCLKQAKPWWTLYGAQSPNDLVG